MLATCRRGAIVASGFEVLGTNPNAPFRLKVHRGDGMALLGMDWLDPQPPADFVGFAIECRPPNHATFSPVGNRITFATPPSNIGSGNPRSSLWAPIQKFRWVHFPFDAEQKGDYVYRVRPAFMSAARAITLGEPQEAAVELRRETYPGQLNVAYTRGFVSSQAFVDTYESAAPISTLIPDVADQGLGFVPTHPKAKEAFAWMGFEARSAILEVLDGAVTDPTAEVRVVAYDLNEPGIVDQLAKLGPRLRIIIDNSDDHGKLGSAETQAATRLSGTAGATHVKRQHMSNLQHNKTIVVEGDAGNVVVCGSTNFTWRGLYVQANNAIVVRGEKAARVFHEAFSSYWANNFAGGFGTTDSTRWRDLGLAGIDAHVSFSPHAATNARLASVGADIESATSSVFYSLAFINQTSGAVRDAITHVTEDPNLFVYGMADRRIGGINLHSPDGNVQPVRPEALTANLPEPFKSEPTGLSSNGAGTRMHHKFVVLDFDKPTARVYTGSYNVSSPADLKNGENLLRIRDRLIATSYMVEALRLFDHYRFRVAETHATAASPFNLKEPPGPGKNAWWHALYTVPIKIRDRKLFS
jgi:phosphatidylserine/phosphatidylglycerophosphate/cardiolipin synthase-like enzyme